MVSYENCENIIFYVASTIFTSYIHFTILKGNANVLTDIIMFCLATKIVNYSYRNYYVYDICVLIVLIGL